MAAEKTPLITIGMACYKSRDTVTRAIESAMAQDWPNTEILIVDDGSGDETVPAIQAAVHGYANARLIVHDKNKGFAGALNTIIAEAKGEFLAIFDDDDVSAPERVRRQYDRIAIYERDYNAGLVVCHTARVQHYPNGYRRYEPTMGAGPGVAPNGRDVADRILTGRLSRNIVGSCANCSRMARIGLFRGMNGYDGGMRRAEDTDFNIRLALAGGHFVGIAEPLVSQTMTMGREKTLEAERAAERILLEKHRPYLEEMGWHGFCREWLEARYEYLNNQSLALIKRLCRLMLRHPRKVMLKLYWTLPARATRRDFKKWHNAEFSPGEGH